MSLVLTNYLLLVAAMLLAALTGLNLSFVKPVEIWVSAASLGILVLVAWRLGGKTAAGLRGRDHSHAHAQKRTLLLFVVAGVVSAFQWLLFFKQLRLGLDLNATLQVVEWILYLVAAAHVGVGIVLLLRGFGSTTSKSGIEPDPQAPPASASPRAPAAPPADSGPATGKRPTPLTQETAQPPAKPSKPTRSKPSRSPRRGR